MSVHCGHKKRLREKAKNDINSLNEHEVLELLLNYTVVRSNMNPIAHNLIRKFGSLHNVFKADEKSLLEVDGLGPVSASMLMLMPAIFEAYKKSRVRDMRRISTSTDAMKFFAELLNMFDNEELYALCLDKNDNIIKLINLAHGNIDTINIEVKEIIQKLLIYQPTRVVLAHNHVAKMAYPSRNDITMTKAIKRDFATAGVRLVDHIIVGIDDVFSFNMAGLFKEDEDKK